jgi:hypothetical protein
MAIIEIAKIQVRRGSKGVTGLPQLDNGELGWAVDTQQLYIGNGSIEDGAPETGNTEILTVPTARNFFKALDLYTYGQDVNSAGYGLIVTGKYGTGDTNRTIFNKLDDNVSVLDFGAVGDGTNATEAIQNAINQTFSAWPDQRTKKVLRFPAGKYIVTATIFVPPYAHLVGDGIDRTILELNTSSVGVFRFCDVDGNVGSQISDNINNINISGFTLKYGTGTDLTLAQPLLSIDSAFDTVVDNCKFFGNHDYFGTTDSENYTGIDITGYGGFISKNVSIKNCVFDKVKNGIKSNYDIEDIFIDNNKFYRLNQGIQWAENLAPLNATGPVNTRITNNLFQDIYLQGIFVGSGSLYYTNHISANNSFANVGNEILGDLDPKHSIIEFQSRGNVSTNDIFYRQQIISTADTGNAVFWPSVRGKTNIVSNVSSTATITLANIPITLCKIPYADGDQLIEMQYILNRISLGASRKGKLTISVSNVLPLPQVTVTENYTFVGDAGNEDISFSATLDTAKKTVKIFYNTKVDSGDLEYQYNILQ